MEHSEITLLRIKLEEQLLILNSPLEGFEDLRRVTNTEEEDLRTAATAVVVTITARMAIIREGLEYLSRLDLSASLDPPVFEFTRAQFEKAQEQDLSIRAALATIKPMQGEAIAGSVRFDPTDVP